MDMAVMYLEEALAHIRAGKASTRLLDGIRVDSYGSMVPISNVAAVTTPDARSIAIKPWDKSMFRIIEKLSWTLIWASLPKTTVKLSVWVFRHWQRNAASNWPNNVKAKAKPQSKYTQRTPWRYRHTEKAVKEGMPEDEQKNAEAKLQKVHDKYIAKIEELLAEKDKEIMTV